MKYIYIGIWIMDICSQEAVILYGRIVTVSSCFQYFLMVFLFTICTLHVLFQTFLYKSNKKEKDIGYCGSFKNSFQVFCVSNLWSDLFIHTGLYRSEIHHFTCITVNCILLILLKSFVKCLFPPVCPFLPFYFVLFCFICAYLVLCCYYITVLPLLQ